MLIYVKIIQICSPFITIYRSCCHCSIVAIQALAFRAVLSIDVRSTAVSAVIIAYHVICCVVTISISNPNIVFTVYWEKFLLTLLILKSLFLLLYKVIVLLTHVFLDVFMIWFSFEKLIQVLTCTCCITTTIITALTLTTICSVNIRSTTIPTIIATIHVVVHIITVVISNPNINTP